MMTLYRVVGFLCSIHLKSQPPIVTDIANTFPKLKVILEINPSPLVTSSYGTMK